MPRGGGGRGRGARSGGGGGGLYRPTYDDIPDDDDFGTDGGTMGADSGNAPNNPFAAGGGGGGGTAIRAGGASSDDDAGFEEYEYGHDYNSTSSSRGGRGRGKRGNRRMPIGSTLGSIRGDEYSNQYAGVMKLWIYFALALVAVMVVLVGVLHEDRSNHHNAATGGGGIEGAPEGRPGAYEDDKTIDDDDYDGLPEYKPSKEGAGAPEAEDAADAADDVTGGGPDDSSESEEDSSSSKPQKEADEGVSPTYPTKADKVVHRYDNRASVQPHDPFHLTDMTWYGTVFAPPPFPAFSTSDDGDEAAAAVGEEEEEEEEDADANMNIGYLQDPDVHNSTLVFTSEGDLYLTVLPPDLPLQPTMAGPTMAAVKLTTTTGNVLTPRINPVYPYLVAYTATYSGTREAYLMELRPSRRSSPALRLTYFDGPYGVSRVVGWSDDGESLVVGAMHDEVGMPDERLFRVGIVQREKLKQEGGDVAAAAFGRNGGNDGANKKSRLSAAAHLASNAAATVSAIVPIPLSQAVDASTDPVTGCLYFTRYRQSSSTYRYVGGTAEHLWAWCGDDGDDGDDDDDRRRRRAVLLTADYRGTSKAPRIYGTADDSDVGGGEEEGGRFLLFLSDRHDSTLDADGDDGDDDASGGWTPSTLNLWALPLPTVDELYPPEKKSSSSSSTSSAKLARPFQVTAVSCEHGGMSLVEYAVDGATGNVLLRVGADLQLLRSEEVARRLWRGGVFGGGAAADDDDGVDGRRLKNKKAKKKEEGSSAKKTKEVKEEVQVDDAEPAEEVEVETDEEEEENDDDDDDGSNIDDDIDDNDDDGVTDDEKDEPAQGDQDKASLTVPKTKKKTATVDNKATSTSITASASSRSGNPSPSSRSKSALTRLPIVVYSDFQNLHERLIPTSLTRHVDAIDVYSTPYGTTSTLMTARGQLYVNPVVPDVEFYYNYEGGGMNVPPRRYRVAPGATTGGMIRILTARVVPQPTADGGSSGMALALATDPLSPTAEMAFYLLETLPGGRGGSGGGLPSFADVTDLPLPLIGGHVSGGSVADGGLGSVRPDSVAVSPCGRRAAWTDTDGRICVLELPDLEKYLSGGGVVESDREAQKRQGQEHAAARLTVLPGENENAQPMGGIGADLTWSPGGRYLAIEHSARNQFTVISIADLGDPDSSDLDGSDGGSGGDGTVTVGRIVQATPDRFNSQGPVWGRTALDLKLEKAAAAGGVSEKTDGEKLPGATTLYFLSDRDVVLSPGVTSPWGTRAPSPHFEKRMNVYALPLVIQDDGGNDEEGDGDGRNSILGELKQLFPAPYSGGGASELMMLREAALDALEKAEEEKEREEEEGSDENRRREKRAGAVDDANASGTPTSAPTSPPEPTSPYPTDTPISFGPKSNPDLSFARRSYRLSNIPTAEYVSIVSQINGDPSLILLEKAGSGLLVKIFSIGDYPTDSVEALPVELKVPEMEVIAAGISTSRHFLYFIYKSPSKARTKVVPNDAEGVVGKLLKDEEFTKNIVDTVKWALSVWPSLEYQQMYSDAWRLLRDYFYDRDMTDIDWPEVHARYLPLVRRCAKREELDDVLRQMAAELSALHVFVYGGEYSQPLHGDGDLEFANEVGSLGATLRRSVEWAGYIVTSIPERDPDFNLMDGKPVYSPLSEQVLRMSGQRGLEVGDVVVGVNGESVMNVPGLHMLLRGTAGRTVRLDVLRVKSGPSPLLSRRRRTSLESTNDDEEDEGITPEPLIVVPLSPEDAANLRYVAWEWKTRQSVKSLSAQAGFTAGYIHLRDMSGAKAEDAFVRGFFPDYDKQALIVDVRHNHGGNIDSWLLDVLQRRAWMYWQGRATNITNGGLGWDEQFAFAGHIVVLIDEKTSSDGEGFSRGVSELGLGKLVGTRTWGGGIWLSSDNKLVDGGIATAPEIGTYNKNFGWGLGIENQGVEPDIEVDNDPRETYDGKDSQLEKAIEVLKDWLEEEPIVLPESPGRHRDMALPEEAKGCPARGI